MIKRTYSAIVLLLFNSYLLFSYDQTKTNELEEYLTNYYEWHDFAYDDDFKTTFAVIEKLFKEGADPNCQGFNYTYLISDILHSEDLLSHHTQIPFLFIKYGINPNIIERRNRSLLQIALHYQRYDFIESLLKAKKDVINDLKPVFDLAIKNNNTVAISLFQSFGYTLQMQPLTQALYENDLSKIESLLEREPESVNKLLENGETPLSMAIKYNHLDSVRLLLNYGVNVNQKNSLGRIPLEYAIASEKEEIAKILIENHSDVQHGNKALYHAINKGYFELAEILLDAGADPNKIYSSIVECSDSLFRKMLEHGLDPYRHYGSTLFDTLLHVIALSPNSERGLKLLEILFENIIIDPNNPVFASNSPVPFVGYELSQKNPKHIKEMVQLFIDNGFDINGKNNRIMERNHASFLTIEKSILEFKDWSDSYSTILDTVFTDKKWKYDKNNYREMIMDSEKLKLIDFLKKHGAVRSNIIFGVYVVRNPEKVNLDNENKDGIVFFEFAQDRILKNGKSVFYFGDSKIKAEENQILRKSPDKDYYRVFYYDSIHLSDTNQILFLWDVDYRKDKNILHDAEWAEIISKCTMNSVFDFSLYQNLVSKFENDFGRYVLVMDKKY